MTAEIHRSVYQVGTQFHFPTKERSKQIDEVAVGLFKYPPFRQIVIENGVNPDNANLSIEPNGILYFFDANSKQIPFQVRADDGPILQAYLFLSGEDVPQPDFTEATHGEAPPSRGEATGEDSHSETPAGPAPLEGMRERIARTHPEGASRDDLMVLVDKLFEKFADLQKKQAEEHRKEIEALSKSISTLGQNMHCYSHGRGRPSRDSDEEGPHGSMRPDDDDKSPRSIPKKSSKDDEADIRRKEKVATKLRHMFRQLRFKTEAPDQFEARQKRRAADKWHNFSKGLKRRQVHSLAQALRDAAAQKKKPIAGPQDNCVVS